MKKSLIALAVAGCFAAPTFAFASSANIDFYGKMRVSVDHLDNSIGWQMNDETSRVGFKGAEDLGGGLKAIYQWESGLNIGAQAFSGSTAGKSTGNTDASGPLAGARNTFVGLAGGFGTVLFGRHDTPYKMVGSADVFGDTLADAENGTALSGNFGPEGRCVICEDRRVQNAIAYVSPNFSGVTIVGATVLGNNGPTSGAKTLADAYSLAGMYSNGPLKLGVGYINLNKVATDILGTAAKPDAWKLNAGYSFGDVHVGATYERLDKIGGVSGQKSNDWLVSAAYGMGPITLAAQYGDRNANSAANNAGIADLTDVTVGVVYSLSKRTSTYAGYAHYKFKNTGAGDSKLNALTFGLNHNF